MRQTDPFQFHCDFGSKISFDRVQYGTPLCTKRHNSNPFTKRKKIFNQFSSNESSSLGVCNGMFS